MSYSKYSRMNDRTSNDVETVVIEDDNESLSSSSQRSLLLAGTPKRNYETIDIFEDDDDVNDYDDHQRRGSGGGNHTNIGESSTTLKSLGKEQKEHHDSTRLGNLSLTVLTICLCIGAGLPGLDTSIIFTTMTKIGSEFQSAQMSTWLHSAYTLCTLITMPAAGGMSNAFGRKPALITLNMLFLIGSFGCGYARSFEQIVAARAIAGLGGGGIALMGNIILHDMVPRDQLGSYLAYLSTSSMLGFGLGAPIGGFITDYFGWRYCFKINILPMILILCIYTFHLKNYNISQNKKVDLTTKEKLKVVDFGGILLLSVANISLTCALLLGGNTYSWSSPQIILALVSTLVGYILFFIHERRWALYPLLSHVASHDRNFTTSCFCIFLMAACEGAALTVIPQFLMGVLHFKTSKAGLWVMMNAAAVPVGTFLAGRYMHYTGRFKRFVIVAMTSYIVAVVIFYNWAGSNVSINLGTMGILMEGASYGCISVCIIVACTSTLSKELAATSLSICTLARFVGYLIGAAVVSSIVQYTLKTVLPTRISGEGAEKLIEFIITSIQKVDTLAPEIQRVVAGVLALGVQRVALFLITGGSLTLLVGATRFQNVSLKKEHPSPATATDENDRRD